MERKEARQIIKTYAKVPEHDRFTARTGIMILSVGTLYVHFNNLRINRKGIKWTIKDFYEAYIE